MFTDTFKSNIKELEQGYTKFMVSRLVSNLRDKIVETQVPATIPDDAIIEISLYSMDDDYLVYNAAFVGSEAGGVGLRTVTYANQEIRRMLFIDFSAIKNNFPIGEFRLVLNIYVPEIGGPEDLALETAIISPSRYEVELQLTPEYDTTEYRERLATFAKPRLTSTSVLVAIDQIFGVPTTETIPSNNDRFTYNTVEQQFPSGLNDNVLTELEAVTVTILQEARIAVVTHINDKILAGQKFFTNTYLQQIIFTQIVEAYARYTTFQAQTNSIAKVTLTTTELV